ncbi:MAG: NAD(P)-dependent oxidoreductase [Hyphomonadaceae bacterium]
MSRIIVLHPPRLKPFAPPDVAFTSIPTESEERAVFLREVAPTVEVGVTAGGTGLPEEFLAAASSLRLICCIGAGYDRTDPVALRKRGVTVTNCPAVNNEDVADMAMGLLLSAARGIAAGDAAIRAGGWRPPGAARSVGARKLGVVGLGAIGTAIAARAAAFRMEIAYTGPRAKPAAPYPYFASLIELARWADVLMIATRADASTNRMIGAAVIEALGPQGVIVNVSRGSVIDEDALIAALRSGALAAAGLDVFAMEPTDSARWAGVRNATLTPHIAGATQESMRASAAIVQENIRRHFAGEPVLHALN